MSNTVQAPLGVKDFVQPLVNRYTSFGAKSDVAETMATMRLMEMFKSGNGGAISKSLNKALATTGIVPQDGTMGADALKREDIVNEVQVTELDYKKYAPLWHWFTKKPCYSDVVQLTELDDWGGEDDLGFLDEGLTDGGLSAIDPNIERDVTPVKWLGQHGQVMRTALAVEALGIGGDPAIGNAGEISSEARLQRLMLSANYLGWHGSYTHNRSEFSGLLAQIRSAHKRGSDNKITRINCAGQPITQDLLADIEQQLFDNGGEFTDLWWGSTSLADTKKQLDVGQRYQPGSGLTLGNFADGYVVQSVGLDPQIVKLHRDRHLDAPKWDGTHADSNSASTPLKPSAVAAANSATNAKNVWDSYLPASTYYYAVCGVSAKGRSAVRAAAAPVVVGASEKAVVTITNNSTDTKFFMVFRGTSATNLKYVGRVIAHGLTVGQTTQFEDKGEYIPGTSTAVAVSARPRRGGFNSVMFRQLWMCDKIVLPNAIMSEQFAWIMAGTPQVLNRPHHVILENIGRQS